VIPRRLIRTVPTDTTSEVEAFWATAIDLHPGWDHVTLRDPIDPAQFPITSPYWERCSHGAQMAGLVRLEALLHHGGIYLDSDVELYRPLDALTHLPGFAGWEDAQTVPDAVLGFEAEHPAIDECLTLAIGRLEQGPWASGPGVTTEVLPGRPDVLLLPPGSFYPYHYSERHLRHDNHAGAHPYAFGAHHWAASWLA
jgi:mannosyltransferase OCH1-like enzyme